MVVTSRYGAWTASNRGLEGQVREVEIEPLAYPKDVTSFVSSWFLDQPHRAQRLLAQIEARAELRRTAVVPLLLTFYCLLAGDGEIPRRRRELYTRLVDQLLSASWVDDQPHVPDREVLPAATGRMGLEGGGRRRHPHRVGQLARLVRPSPPHRARTRPGRSTTWPTEPG